MGADRVGRGQKRREVAKGPRLPWGSTVKGKRAITWDVNSWIRACPTACLVSRFVNI